MMRKICPSAKKRYTRIYVPLDVGSTNFKETVSRDFVFGFTFHQSIFLGPNRHVQKLFRFFSNIRGIIRAPNILPGDEYIGESQLHGGEYTEELITTTNMTLVKLYLRN